MTFKDIFKKSFLEGWASTGIGTTAIVTTLLVTSFLALYIFLAYRVITKKTFYSKNFNISLAGVSVITAAIIVTIQSSVVISLGMVGALSIVRFRTAIKDPIDLMFLFWSISVGIICGAGFAAFAAILSITLTVGILILEHIPVAKAPMILVVNTTDLDAEKAIMDVVNQFCKHPHIKSRNMTSTTLDITVELRTDDGGMLVRSIMGVNGVCSSSLLAHDGEVTF
jgi:hypothetical protein